jgi:CubicO group peptidase (beta-lactamase class C family)
VSTDVLGHLIEIWSGVSLEEFFRVRIFKPLGMNDTGFQVEPNNHDRFAACYRPLVDVQLDQDGTNDESAVRPTGYRLFDGTNDSRFIRPAGTFSGGGGLVGSMPDYARFCQMLLNRGEFDGERLLSRPTTEYMCTNHLPQNRDLPAMNQEAWNSTSYAGIGFGLGFAVVMDPVNAHLIASPGECHWGGAASTVFWIDPKEDLFAIFFTQLTPSNTHPFRREFRVQVNQTLID